MSVSAIADAHVHLWDPARFRYAWLDNLPALNRAFLPPDFSSAIDALPVRKMIVVESACDPAQSLAEVDWLSELAKTEPRLKGVIAHVSLEKGAAVHQDLETLAARPLVKGVRRNLQGERDPDFCRRPEWIHGIELLAEFNFTFDLCVRHEQLGNVTELARRVPQVQFILDHLGKPDVRGQTMEPWASDLKALARLPNVVCKISGLATEADWARWQVADLKGYCDRALEYFGGDRLLFGGDWPVATLATHYQRWFETVQALFPAAAEDERNRLFLTNTERIYRV